MQRVSVTEKDATDRVRCRHMINPSKGQPKEDEAVDTDQSAVDMSIGQCMSGAHQLETCRQRIKYRPK